MEKLLLRDISAVCDGFFNFVSVPFNNKIFTPHLIN